MSFGRVWLAGSLRAAPVLRFLREGTAETRFDLIVESDRSGHGSCEVHVRCRGPWAEALAEGIDGQGAVLVEGQLARRPDGRDLIVMATRVDRLE